MQPWGYIKLSRKAYATDPLWLEARTFSKWEAWEDMIQMAAYRGHRRTIGAEVLTLHRGEFVASLRYLAIRWAWSVKMVRGTLKQLVRTGRIRAQRGAQAGTVYLITNYHTYQGGGHRKGTPEGTMRAQQGHSKGTKEKSRKKGNMVYPPEFEETWKVYPKRQGPNSKRAAFRQWSARLGEGVSPAAMLAGTMRYAAECRAEWGTRFVKQAATFYGRDRHFEYDAPTPPLGSLRDAYLKPGDL